MCVLRARMRLSSVTVINRQVVKLVLVGVEIKMFLLIRETSLKSIGSILLKSIN